MRARCSAVALVALLSLGAVVAVATTAGGGIAVIVHPERRDALDHASLRRIFLKQRRFWGDGTAIVPVNHEAGSELREAFTRGLFGEGQRDQSSYWDRRYFQGVLPPATLSSPESVLAFVARTPEAVGYVDVASVDDSVRVAATIAPED